MQSAAFILGLSIALGLFFLCLPLPSFLGRRVERPLSWAFPLPSARVLSPARWEFFLSSLGCIFAPGFSRSGLPRGTHF